MRGHAVSYVCDRLPANVVAVNRRSNNRSSPQAEPAEPGGRAPAPEPLRLVQLFINSEDLEGGTDALATTDSLGSWLREHHLLERKARLSTTDLERVHAFRSLLRSLSLANNGHLVDSSVLADLNVHLRSTPMIARFRTPSDFDLEGTGSVIDQVLGRLVAIVIEEVIRGRWFRLKACARDVCRWVFFDHSRSRTGTWCTMAICGSRTKVNAYYRRNRTRRGSPRRARKE
jgi:predicted RNA-binding Zn ribbon-like protein